MNWVETLKEEYSLYDPKILEAGEGACASDIQCLEECSGAELPINYLLFLENYGVNHAGLLDKLPLVTDIKTVLGYYKECIYDFPDELPPKGWIVIGIWHIGGQLALNIENGQIYQCDYGEIGEYYAEDIVKLVNQEAFRKYKIRSNPKYLEYNGSALSVNEALGASSVLTINQSIISVCTEFGLEISTLSDLNRVYATGGGLHFACDVDNNGALWFLVAGEDHELAKIFAAKVGKVLGATLV